MTSASPSLHRQPPPPSLLPLPSATGRRGEPDRLLARRRSTPPVARRHDQEVHAIDGLFRVAFERTPHGAALLDADGRFLFANRAMIAMLGVDESDLLTTTLSAFLDAESAPFDLSDALCRLLVDPTPLRVELRYRCGIGEPAWGLLALSLLDGGDAAPIFAVHLDDITERKQAEERLRWLAFHDVVTGLPNRALFEERLSAAVERVAADRGELAVLFIDLDNFKAVNDAFGHRGGDGLLRTVAERLRASVRPTDLVARYGGDEFAILIEDAAVAALVGEAVGRIEEELQGPVRLDPASVALSASVGIAVGRPGQREPEAIMREADAAMYRAKLGRRGGRRHTV